MIRLVVMHNSAKIQASESTRTPIDGEARAVCGIRFCWRLHPSVHPVEKADELLGRRCAHQSEQEAASPQKEVLNCLALTHQLFRSLSI